MATQRSSKRLSALKKSRKFRDLSRQESRRLHLEQLEDRRVMAVFVLPNNGELLNNGDTRTIAPQDLTFRFTDIPGLDPTTIANGIQLRRAGGDGQFGQANDVVVTPGFIGLGDNNREVIMRFAETLPDDTYQITIFGAGTTPLRDTAGNPINGGANQSLNFRLDLGAQVIAVVPQPVRKLANGTLAMNEVNPANPAVTRSTQNMVYVYFNDDKLDPASATNREFYRLYVTKNTLDPSDDTEVTPTSVEYDQANNLVRLIFGQVASLDQLAPFNPSTGIKDPIGSFRLRIGTNEPLRNGGQPTVTQRLGATDPGSSFATAYDLGNSITTGSQGATVSLAQAIEAQAYSLVWPGAIHEPGHRDIPAETHLNGGADTAAGVTTRFYNFRPIIGTIPDGIGGSQPAFNLITENQKERAREIFDLYSRYSGIQFIESDDQGIIVATADPRVIAPDIDVNAIAGIASGNLAIMDSNDTWNDSYGANWFQVAMHEIGHVLGQGHTYDLPPLTIQGDDGGLSFGVGPEPVFPGDHDIVHMRHMYRPDSKDIDMYRFTLDGTGVLRLEAFAERLPNSSSLDTTLRLYRVGAGGALEEIARNDDYFSKDSKIELTLGPGTYFVGVTASGNDQYDPTIVDSGMGGTTQGAYELKLDFRKSATQSIVDRTLPTGLIPDTLNVAFDGDADGVPGGVYNFWFRAAPLSIQTGRARTIFVDKAAPNGGNGLISSPYNNIQTAMNAATEFDIVRIVGNGGADGNLATLSDNLAYQIGFGGASGSTPLVDGTDLSVKKNVTVMIDAGAIFQMRRSHIVVGSTAPSIFSDRSGGALQVLGTPTNSVYFTSFNELGPNSIGLDQNPFNVPPAAGDWGGLYFKNDLDTADGRFDHEAVGVFLNYVNHADIRFGGGQVNVDSLSQVVTPINILDRRPAVTFNTISNSANAAMSANPDSFEETNFQAPRFWPTFSNVVGYNPSGIGAASASRSFTLDYDRVGPDIHGNRLVNNSTNALFVRTRTPAGNVLEELTVAGRFDDTDIVHVLEENLSIKGTPSGPTLEETPPPVELVFISELFGQGNYSAGVSLEYKLTFVDALGNESLASESFFTSTTVPNAAILMEQLQEVPSPQYVARKLYRRTSPSQPFTLVDQIPASVTQYLDRNLPTSGNLQQLRVLSTPGSITRPRLDAGLVIDPSIIIKSDGARIDVGIGTNFIAEGFAGQEIVFTSLADDRYGAGSTFDTNNDSPRLPAAPTVATLRQGSASQNEQQTVTLVGTPTAGAFTLTFNGQTSGPIAYSATAAALQTALEGLGNIAPGDVLVSKAGNVWTIEFRGTYANQNVAQMTANIAAIGSPALPGDWGGIFFSPDSQGSIDNAVFAYAGGLNRIEGTFAGFNTLEIHQADVRITQSKFEFNEDGEGGQAPADRFGRGFNAPGTIFVRGAQPVIMDNIGIFNAGAFININVNALNHEKVVDWGRQSGMIEREPGHLDNNGPLILRNRLRDNDLHGMVVRGGTLTTESVWDDTDIVHILFDQITIPDFHTFGGLRLESSPTQSLVVKSSGATAGITATGRPLEIDDRIGGMLHILGQPGVPVVLTGLSDDTEGAGVTPEGLPQYDTDGNGDGTGGGGGGGGLPTGPEVNNGTIIDNDVDPNTVGFFRFQPGPGGSVSFSIPNSLSGVTAQGQTQLLIDQDFIFDFLNYVDVGANGGAIDLSTTTITQAPTLVSDDLVVSQGTFAGANGPVNWRVETRIDDGISIVYNTLILNSASPFGSLRFVNYLDEDVINLTQNLLYQVGSPGQADFRLYTLDNGERIGFSQGGVYAGGPDLVNATYDGWAADAYSDLVTAIEGPGTTYSPTGNIDTTDLTPFIDPALGNVHGLADVTTAMAWTVDPTATTARITTFLELIPQAPIDTGNPGEWQGITIDQWAHDRNVETVLELESGDGSVNSTPSRAQFLGGLGPFEKGGDENLRLGYTMHGVVVNPADVDVYSFQGRSGTEVWIDLDRTTHALDAVVELIDNNGNVLARSNNSVAESAGQESRTGLARAMQKTPPYEGDDFYTTNPRDGGMRLLLPGPTNTTNTYFVRVRSNTGTISVLDVRNGGQLLVTEHVKGFTTPSNADIAEQTPGGGGLNEVQLVFASTGNPFTLTFQGQTTAPISPTASGIAVQNALVALPNIAVGDVIVTEFAPSIWLVEFTGNYANQNLPLMTSGAQVNEIQQISLPAGISGSTFTLTFNGQTTAPISMFAGAAAVQTALVNLSNINPGDVTVTGGGGGPWDVFFGGQYAGQDVPALVGRFNEAQQLAVVGNPAGGGFTLTFGNQTTASIPHTATAAQVQAALEALSNIEPGDVLVTGGVGGPWTVEYRGAYSGVNLPLITANSEGLTGGQTSGSYQLQLRLREVDEFGGTTVRFAKIANAVNGIHVIGQPTHSPLSGEAAETNNATNNTFGGSQFIGNLLNTDRGVLSVGGSMSGLGDVDWYSLNINYDATQGIPGVSTLEDWWSTIFDIDYADGYARPNLIINVFDANGNLVLSSRDSNVADDRPNPLNAADSSDLSRGSSGAADPWIGPVELPQGQYFVAISNDAQLPAVLDQFFQANATNPLVRLEPMNSIQRIVEDHIQFSGGSTGSDPIVPEFIDGESFVPFHLGDVTLYVAREAPVPGVPERTELHMVDPFTGFEEMSVGAFTFDVGDIAFNGTNLFAYQTDLNDTLVIDDADSGRFLQISTQNAAATQVGQSGIVTYEPDPGNPANPVVAHLFNNARVGWGIQLNAMVFGLVDDNPASQRLIAVGNRGEADFNLNGFLQRRRNIVYQMNTDTGAHLVTGGARLNGAATNAREVGEILTSPRIFTVDATSFVAPNTTNFVIQDGLTFSVDDGTGITTFEFDSGPEVRQLIDINNDQPLSNVNSQQHIFDGDFFILDRDADLTNGNETMYQFNTGPVIVVEQGNPIPGGINDGNVVVISDNLGRQRNFEFERAGGIAAGNIAVNIGTNTDPAAIATILSGAINGQTGGGYSVTTRVFGNRISLENDGAVAVASAAGLRVDGDINPAPVLDALPGDQIADGTIFTVSSSNTGTLTFEFEKGGGVTGTNIAVNINNAMTAVQVANAIEAAVDASSISLFASTPARVLGSRVVLNAPGISYGQGTSPIVNLTAFYTGQAQFFNVDTSSAGVTVEETSPARIVGQAVQTVVNNVASPFTAAFDDHRINFAAFPQGGGKFPTVEADFSGVTAWQVVTTSAFGVAAGNVSIPFLANDTALALLGGPSIATRIATAINNALSPAVTAQAVGSNVDLSSGLVIVDPAGPLTTAGEGPGGNIIGIALIDDDSDPNPLETTQDDMYAISDRGGLYKVELDLVDNSNLPDFGNINQVFTQYIRTSEADLRGINFQSLTRGPNSVEGTRYQNLLFGMTDDGEMYAFNSQGILQPIFTNGATSIDTGLNNVRGIAFGQLEANPWTTTPNSDPNNNHRQNDPGHGLEPIFDESRNSRSNGGSSIHFGRGQNSDLNFNGGSYGTVISNEFSLQGYSAADQPVLYFNYFAETENRTDILTDSVQMADSFRVFVADDSGDWELVATNNSGRGPELLDDEYDYGTTLGLPLVQELFDGTAGSPGGWRQARVDLAAYAGRENLRLRFDYSSAGDMQVGDFRFTGDELRAVEARFINDGDTTTIDGTPFQFELGYTLHVGSGAAFTDGQTFTIDDDLTDGVAPVVFEFEKAGGVASGRIAVPISNSSTPQQVAAAIINAINASALVINPVYLGDDVIQLPEAQSFTTTVLLSGFVTGEFGPSPGSPANTVLVPILRSWDRVQVADALNDEIEIALYDQQILAVSPFNTAGNPAIVDGDTFTLTLDGVDTVFEFESGYVLNVPSLGAALTGPAANRVLDNSVGSGTAEGFQITANGNTVRFEFDGDAVTHLVNPSHVAIPVNSSFTQLGVARAVANAINASGLGITATVLSGSRVQIDTTGNDTVVFAAGTWNAAVGGGNVLVATPGKYTTAGTPGVANPLAEPVLFQPSSTFRASQIAATMVTSINASALGSVITASSGAAGGADQRRVELVGPDVTVTSTVPGIGLELNNVVANDVVKQHRDLIRIIGYSVDDPGPLGFDDALEADEFGNFNSTQRMAANTFEGVYFDDIIIGFAERGEMAVNAGANTGFAANPLNVGNNIETGEYQLEIRRGAEAGIPAGSPDSLALLPSFDTNERLARTRMLIAPTGAEIFDTQIFTLSDGVNNVTFEFNDASTPGGSGVTQGRIRIDYFPSDSAEIIARRIRAAIHSAPVQSVLRIAAQLSDGVLGNNSTTNWLNLLGSISIPNPGGLNFVAYNEQYGDRNHFRDQGQIILYGNEIVNSSEWGILIDAAPRNAADGNLPHPGSVRNLQELNTQRLVPGVVVMNNTIYNSGTGGIRFSGDPAADAAVPFGRIVNNTLYGQGGSLTSTAVVDTGIQVDQNAAPTILNNIVANFTTGINVDASSQGPTRTVLGGTVYQGNINNSNIGLGGSFPIVVPNSQPLFVNPDVGNFYPAFGSPAIDSSVDSLLDRPALVTVRNPLGILQSPILSPDRDGVGQLRVDDPNVNTPQGFGLNPFKDRGAIDRVDFVGPTSLLISPPDNDAEGTDLDPAPTTVVRANDIIREFRIQLIDRFDVNAPPEGSDVDDFTVTAATVVVEVLDGPNAGILDQGIDYSFSYDATNNTIILNPLGGIWPLGRTYRIYLNNSLTGIRDQAGNPLLPNQADGISHYYTIFLGSAVDWGDAPASYGVLAANNGPSHTLNPNIRLGATAGAEADGQPSASANADSGDDGLLAYVLSRGALSSVTIEASAVGFVHVWVDLDQDGTFDTDEYLVQGATFDTPGAAAIFDLGILPDGGQGDSFMRIRFTTGSINSPVGPAPDGEVEDYLIQITGPAYHNGNPNTVPADVDNNGVVNILDLLHVVNFLTYLESKLITPGSPLTVPPTSPPYRADDLPEFDPSGGGVPGAARYIDVSDQNPSGTGYGQINLFDLLAVVNYIVANFDPGDGEGEAAPADGGEGEASPTIAPTTYAAAATTSSSTSSRSSSHRASLVDSATLYAAGNITLEVRERSASPLVETEWEDESDEDDLLALMAAGQAAGVATDDDSLAFDRHLHRQSPMGPLDADSWESLLSELAQDVGGLPDDDFLS
ncbi:MAG: GEVED domain-containing protein [Pirellulaceae bacterium]|nr:GEVED domain-containing protein [Pirellulaceae bacterium]